MGSTAAGPFCHEKLSLYFSRESFEFGGAFLVRKLLPRVTHVDHAEGMRTNLNLAFVAETRAWCRLVGTNQTAPHPTHPKSPTAASALRQGEQTVPSRKEPTAGRSSSSSSRLGSKESAPDDDVQKLCAISPHPPVACLPLLSA